METAPPARKKNRTGTVLISALIGALVLGLLTAAILVILVASGMNSETSNAAQKDWFPLVAIFWGVVGGIGGGLLGALLGCVTGFIISRK